MLTRFAAAADLSETDAVVVGLKTRSAPRIKPCGPSRGPPTCLPKAARGSCSSNIGATFDSTRHGNIGPLRRSPCRQARGGLHGVLPRLSEVKRTVFQGHLFAFDQIISEFAEAPSIR